MPGPRQPRVSWDALWSYANERGIMTMGDLAERSGVDVRTLYLFKNDGVNERAADRIAVALGDVPEAIWGVEYVEATEYLIEKAEAEEAVQRTRAAAVARKYRRTHPEYAQRQRAKVEQWKAANPDRVKRYHADYQRAWRARQGEDYVIARREYQRAYRASRQERKAS